MTNPAFAAFGATQADQTAMGKRINSLGKGTCYHGNAGIASAFAALVNAKLKPGGVLAMVLPLSAAAGLSWQGFREMLGGEYTDLSVLSIAANGKDMSFSSDTGMAECLVIARKLRKGEAREGRGMFTSLANRPAGFANANLLARGLIEADEVRTVEDGPYGGSTLMEGDTPVGEALSAPSSSEGGVWGAVRISDYSVAQTADALTELEAVAARNVESSRPAGTPSWRDWDPRLGRSGHNRPDAKRPFRQDDSQPNGNLSFAVEPQRQERNANRLRPRLTVASEAGMEEKSDTVWATASRSHVNRDFHIRLPSPGSRIHRAEINRRQGMA